MLHASHHEKMTRPEWVGAVGVAGIGVNLAALAIVGGKINRFKKRYDTESVDKREAFNPIFLHLQVTVTSKKVFLAPTRKEKTSSFPLQQEEDQKIARN